MLFECEIALFRFEEGREGIRSWVELEKREGIREKLYAHARTTKATMAEEESARQFRAASLSFTVTITLAPPPVPRPFDRLRTRAKNSATKYRSRGEREWIKSISLRFLLNLSPRKFRKMERRKFPKR